jgi:predicted component of type VI protein secretion system
VTRTLELPESVYDALVEAARSGGVAPSEWIASRLPRPERPPASEADREAALARLRQFAGTVSLGHPTGIDNEQIDADLAREYLDPHETS